MRQQLALDLPIPLRNSARQVDHFIGALVDRLIRAPVLFLQTLRVRLRDTYSVHDVAGHVRASVRDGAEEADLLLVENREIGRPGAHLDERDAQLLLLVGDDGEGARERFEHELPHLVAGPLDRLAEIERRRGADRDQIHLGLEAHATHSDRIADTGVAVDAILLRNRVEQLAIRGNRLRAGHFVGALDVGARHLVAIHGDDARAVHRLDVLARDSRVHAIHLHARHSLGLAHRFLDGLCGLLNVGDDAAAHSRGARVAHAENFQRAVERITDRLGDDGGSARRAYVEAGDQSFGIHCVLAMT